MKYYWVEGVYVPKTGGKKGAKRRILEPFARSIWAASPEEALRLANEAIEGGEWREGPRISKKSEEQRMREQGAPELPGFASPKKEKHKK